MTTAAAPDLGAHNPWLNAQRQFDNAAALLNLSPGLRAVLRGQASTLTRLGWIDLHTGLGPRGHGEKIWAGRDEPEAIARARAWWGAEVTSAFEGSASASQVSEMNSP